MRKEHIWAYLIGTGFVLFAIHNPNQPLARYAFLPVVGLVFSMLGMIIVLKDYRKQLTLGDKRIWIPLLVIAASIALSGIPLAMNSGETGMALLKVGVTPLLFGVFLFGVYLTARVMGDKLFTPFTVAVIIGSIGTLVYSGILHPGTKTGGWISPTNYDMATGLLVFGTVVCAARRQWWLASIAVVGLFFTGADEALFCCGAIVGCVVVSIVWKRIYRKRWDWSKKMLLPIATLAITVAVCMPLGITQGLWLPAVTKIAQAKEVLETTPIAEIIDKVVPDVVQKPITTALDKATPIDSQTATTEELLHEATGKRWGEHWVIPVIQPVGYGYNINEFYQGIPHNVALIITHQVGPLAALAWLWVCGFAFFKTRWKYAIIGVLCLSFWDHYFWTQVAPWWWCLIGVATASVIKSDKVLKEV